MLLRLHQAVKLALASLVLLASFGSGPATAAAILPPLAAINLDGRPFRFDAPGLRPAVINVWATWCPPCRNEMASLQRLAANLKPDGVAVVALSVDTDHNLVREFVLKYGIKIPTPIATTPREAMSALDVSALPVTLYVDAGGRIVGRNIGQRDWSDEASAQDVRRALSVPQRATR
ncbi:MAG TPA: TlpA disulfide reductase family protein [Aromatoleum sp.]|uniref:TlpA family protein disulfide reductase n=1 Tax=Aromatoleum sp. TaxID=2307007 RepID=UPI002B47B90A|nr:TlpA disulfide reductase family protein [Aromatoleum sp.]HJV25470.1 TlpA disulfide reductase family protein [Aromatoleum sp.]